MLRYIKRLPKSTALVALVVLSAACSTDAPSPLAPTTVLATAPALAASTAPITSYIGDTLVVEFVVVPGSMTTVQIGTHRLKIPQNSVCDPARSTYGPTEWDKGCVLLTTNLRMSVKSWTNLQGNAQMDFSRDLRFVGGKGGELPTLYFMDKKAVDDPMANILYCATPTGVCIDESLTDPTVRTLRDLKNGYIYRFIKHFSGYNVWA